MIDGPPVECPGEERTWWDVALAELKAGTLSLVQTVRCDYYQLLYVNIWRLVDSSRSIWVKECTIRAAPCCTFFKALDIFDDGRMLMLCAFRKQSENLCDFRWMWILKLYNRSTGAVTDLMEMAQDFMGQTTLYTGSLLS